MKEMKNKAKNIVGAGLVSLALSLGSCGKNLPNEHLLPEVGKNQKLVLEPSYVKGEIPLGYTRYTDQNEDGIFDSYKKVWVGNTPNSYKVEYGTREDVPSKYGQPRGL